MAAPLGLFWDFWSGPKASSLWAGANPGTGPGQGRFPAHCPACGRPSGGTPAVQAHEVHSAEQLTQVESGGELKRRHVVAPAGPGLRSAVGGELHGDPAELDAVVLPVATRRSVREGAWGIASKSVHSPLESRRCPRRAAARGRPRPAGTARGPERSIRGSGRSTSMRRRRSPPPPARSAGPRRAPARRSGRRRRGSAAARSGSPRTRRAPSGDRPPRSRPAAAAPR